LAASKNDLPFTMKFSLTILSLVIALNLFAQTAGNTNRFNEGNIYYQTLTQYLSYLKSDRNLTYDTLYIEDNFRLTDSLLLQSGQTKFIILNSEDILQILKTKRNFLIHHLFPLEFENGDFSVSLVPFSVTKGKKGNKVNYINSGSNRIVFKFDNGKFNFIKLEHHSR
jgi:hypothetical protein